MTSRTRVFPFRIFRRESTTSDRVLVRGPLDHSHPEGVHQGLWEEESVHRLLILLIRDWCPPHCYWGCRWLAGSPQQCHCTSGVAKEGFPITPAHRKERGDLVIQTIENKQQLQLLHSTVLELSNEMIKLVCNFELQREHHCCLDCCEFQIHTNRCNRGANWLCD